MSVRARIVITALALTAAAGLSSHVHVATLSAQQAPAAAAAAGPVFEVRTYIASAGKLEDLHARFRDHTIRIFARHGMKSIAYWIPADQRNTLVYIIQHESRAQATANWAAFMKDPEWMKVAAASNAPRSNSTRTIGTDSAAKAAAAGIDNSMASSSDWSWLCLASSLRPALR